MDTMVHLISAVWALFFGAIQVMLPKGTRCHKAIGWSWMLAMVVTSISSFGITGFIDWFYGYGPIHLLSIWVLVCVFISVYSAKKGNISFHRSFAVGAYIGTIIAGVGAALMPGRIVHTFIFG